MSNSFRHFVSKPTLSITASEVRRGATDSFEVFLIAEIGKTTPEARSARETPPSPKCVDSDELARIEDLTRALTRRLIDFGLHPQVAGEAAMQQVRNPDPSLATSSKLRVMATVFRKLSATSGILWEASKAGASLAIADWLDERVK